MRSVSVPVPCLLALSLAACAGAPAAPATFVDARGVEIVETDRVPADFPAVGEIEVEPSLDLVYIDPEDPLGVFGAVSAIRSLPDASFLVGDGSIATIGWFAEDGTAIRRIGGRGESPGQFRTLTAIPLATADSLWVWDEASSRMTTFALAGGTPGVRSIIAGANSRFARVDVLPDRRFLAVARARTLGAALEAGANLAQRDSLRFSVFDPVGRPLESVLTIPGEEWLQMQFGQQDNFIMTMTAQLPLGRDAAYTVTERGILGGANDRFEIHRWDFSGRLVRTSRFPGLEVPVTEGLVDEMRQRWISDAGGVAQRLEHIDSVFDPDLIPEVRPAFARILADREGRIWVQEFDPLRAGGARWWLFDDASGQILGWLEAPEGLDVLEFAPDHVLGVFRDETGLPHVRRHALRLRTP